MWQHFYDYLIVSGTQWSECPPAEDQRSPSEASRAPRRRRYSKGWESKNVSEGQTSLSITPCYVPVPKAIFVSAFLSKVGTGVRPRAKLLCAKTGT